MSTKFADLHCHSTMFPFNQLEKSVWHEHKHLFYPSQGDFIKLAKGSTRVLFLSVYPVEQGFLSVKKLGLETGRISDSLAHLILNMPKPRADEIQSYDHNYFTDLQNEYDYLLKFADPYTEKINNKEFRFKVVRNFDELSNVLNLDKDLNYNSAADDTIAVILTIEGAHSLGTGQKNTIALDYTELSPIVSNNIRKLKSLGPEGMEGLYCPFFISLSHHFWNQLGGHSVSLWKLKRKMFDQKIGINESVKDLGKLVVNELLSKENGKRILIDAANMSIQVRLWYYKEYLPGREKVTGEKIPIIVSHTGVNGFSGISESEMRYSPAIAHDVADKLYHESKKFNPWDVFISDEEISIIHDSEGLIGLNLDKRIMMGKESLNTARRNARWKPPSEKDKIWIEPYIEQIMHIARTIYAKNHNETNIWDNICIGSDYDGMITPIRRYKKATCFPKLERMIFEGLKKRVNSEPFLLTKSDSQIRDITDKIIWKNVLKFLKKHFN